MKQNTDRKKEEQKDNSNDRNLKEEIINELKYLSDKCEEQNKDRIEKAEYLEILARYLKFNIPIYIIAVLTIFIFLNFGSSETNYYQLHYFTQVFKISICTLPLSFLIAFIRCLTNKKISDYYKDFTKRILIKIFLLSIISIGYLIVKVFL